jgi:hypothetical protein
VSVCRLRVLLLLLYVHVHVCPCACMFESGFSLRLLACVSVVSVCLLCVSGLSRPRRMMIWQRLVGWCPGRESVR